MESCEKGFDKSIPSPSPCKTESAAPEPSEKVTFKSPIEEEPRTPLRELKTPPPERSKSVMKAIDKEALICDDCFNKELVKDKKLRLLREKEEEKGKYVNEQMEKHWRRQEEEKRKRNFLINS